MRRSQPHLKRPFRTPFVPLVPILGVIVCGGMIVALDHRTQITAFAWMLLGLVVYFAYSKGHSRLNEPASEALTGPLA